MQDLNYYLLCYFVQHTLIMVQNCCVVDCKNVWRQNSSTSYHMFPLKNKERLAQWMQIDELKNINITRAKRICSAHFAPESFEEYCTVKRLKKNAVPSIFGDAVQVIDEGPMEIIETVEIIETIDVTEKINTDNIPEALVKLDEISKVQVEKKQEVEKEQEAEVACEANIKEEAEEEQKAEIGQETEVECEANIKQEVQVEYESCGETEVEQNINLEEIFLSDAEEYNFPPSNVIETKDASVQTLSVYYEYREEIMDLRKKIAMLRQQIKQSETSIASTRELIYHLKNDRVSKKNTRSPTLYK